MEIELRRATALLDYLGRKAWEDGEEITITHKGKPYLKLIPHPDGSPFDELNGTRGIGLGHHHGKIWLAPDFDDNTEIIEAFEGKYSNDEHLFEDYLVRPQSVEESAEHDSTSATGTDS